MMMDTRIPLAGQTPDIIGNLSRGQSAADIFNKQKAEQTERLFLRENGQALSAGDPGALQAYANINLEGSMALQSHFEAKRKAEAARAAAAANAATKATAAEEKRRIGAGMAALTVEQARINGMNISDEEKTEEFLRAQASILRPETRAMMAEQGIDLNLGNLDTYFTRLSGDLGIDWKPNVAAAPKTTDDITEYNAAKDGGFAGTFADWMGKTDKPDELTAVELANIAKTKAETAKIQAEMGAAPKLPTEIATFNAAWSATGRPMDTPDYQAAVKERFIDIKPDGSMPAAAIQLYDRYVADEAAEGRAPMGILEFQKTLKDKGMSIRVDENGAFELTTGDVDGAAPTSKGGIAADKEFAKTYNEFVAMGGAADSQKMIAQLKSARKELLSGEELTGPVIGNMPDWAAAFFAPKSIEAREKVEEVVQRNLRLILGAQFAQKEGEQLIARAYNPKLDEKTNAKRVGRLILQMERALDAKIDAVNYWESHNQTLKGWDGRQFTLGDFMDVDLNAPSIGEIQGGYKYKGGDPTKEESWEKVN